MCAGAILGVSTVVFSAINAISTQQAVAMAVPAIVAITGGLVRMLVLDSWAAWQPQSSTAAGRPWPAAFSVRARMTPARPTLTERPPPSGWCHDWPALDALQVPLADIYCPEQWRRAGRSRRGSGAHAAAGAAHSRPRRPE